MTAPTAHRAGLCADRVVARAPGGGVDQRMGPAAGGVGDRMKAFGAEGWRCCRRRRSPVPASSS